MRATTAFLALIAFATAGAYGDIVETRTLDETVPVTGSSPRVVVRDVFGTIRVTAHDEAAVVMHATETVRAATSADLEKARTVKLAIDRTGDEVAFRVKTADGDDYEPWGCRCQHWDDFSVAYDIELSVPRGAALDLATVNNGDIVVTGVAGDFEIANVNGGVRLDGLRGAGTVTTVNGPVEAAFVRAPAANTSFKTMNGRIEVAFPPGLSADLAFKTVRGDVWTDFAGTAVQAAPTVDRSSRGGKLVIRSTPHSIVRVGGGGPVHSFETMNGDIYVLEVR